MINRFRCLFLTLACLSVTTQLAQATSEWPFVRGPQFNGHADDETQSISVWPSDGPPVLWIRKLGQGYSAFVAAKNCVYTQAQNATGQYLYCLEADTGTTIWEYRYDWPYEAAGVYPGTIISCISSFTTSSIATDAVRTRNRAPGLIRRVEPSI